MGPVRAAAIAAAVYVGALLVLILNSKADQSFLGFTLILLAVVWAVVWIVLIGPSILVAGVLRRRREGQEWKPQAARAGVVCAVVLVALVMFFNAWIPSSYRTRRTVESSRTFDACGEATTAREMRVQVLNAIPREQSLDERFHVGALDHIGIDHHAVRVERA